MVIEETLFEDEDDPQHTRAEERINNTIIISTIVKTTFLNIIKVTQIR